MSNTTTDNMRRDRSLLLDELSRAGADVTKPSKFRCPFHDDNNPSAAVYEGRDGVWRFKCHGCEARGDVFDVRVRISGRSVGEELKAVQADREPRRRPTTLTKTHAISDGTLVMMNYTVCLKPLKVTTSLVG